MILSWEYREIVTKNNRFCLCVISLFYHDYLLFLRFRSDDFFFVNYFTLFSYNLPFSCDRSSNLSITIICCDFFICFLKQNDPVFFRFNLLIRFFFTFALLFHSAWIERMSCWLWTAAWARVMWLIKWQMSSNSIDKSMTPSMTLWYFSIFNCSASGNDGFPSWTCHTLIQNTNVFCWNDFDFYGYYKLSFYLVNSTIKRNSLTKMFYCLVQAG